MARLVSSNTCGQLKPLSLLCIASLVACSIVASSLTTARALNSKPHGSSKRSNYDLDAGWARARERPLVPSRARSADELAAVYEQRQPVRALYLAPQYERYEPPAELLEPDWLNDERDFQRYLLKLKQQQQQPPPRDNHVINDENLMKLLAELPLLVNQDQNQNQQQQDEPLAADDLGLQLNDGGDQEKRQDSTRQPEQRDSAKFTSLLEDEEANDNKPAPTTPTTTPTTSSAQSAPLQAPSTSTPAPEASTTADSSTVSYGTVVTGKPVGGAAEPQPTAADSTSVFRNMYSKVVAYLPFLDQLSILAEPRQRNLTEAAPTAAAAAADDGLFTSELNAKPRVSVQTGSASLGQGPEAKVGDETNDNSDGDSDSVHETRRPTQEARVDEVTQTPATSSSEQDGFDNNGTGNKRTRVHVDLFKKSPVDVLRPLEAASHDELLLDGEGRALKGETLPPSKYIYAPTHHYYLGGVPLGPQKGSLEADELTGGPRPAHLRRIQPGDLISGPYAGASVKDDYLMLNKSNDIYFLVMVGAFCVMAMAVVLAAGLFAYRVQQNRKTNLDADYPTYGVVGPSNLNGKCGAAAFVGGYFGAGGPGNGQASAFASKSGSVKNLPDSASGDSGVGPPNSDKSSGKRGAVEQPQVGLQQQHQQVLAAGQRSANYMNNQNAARMYHYQHQKQQMIISDRASTGRHTSASDLDSEDENEEGSYTVYECPGLASAHEMEIKNPLFNDDRTP